MLRALMRAQSCPQHSHCVGRSSARPASMQAAWQPPLISSSAMPVHFALQPASITLPPAQTPQARGSNLPRQHRSTQQCTVRLTTRGTWRVPRAHWQTLALQVFSTRGLQQPSWLGPAGGSRKRAQQLSTGPPRGCGTTSSMGLPSQSCKVCCPCSVAAAGAVLAALKSPTAMLSVATAVLITWPLHCNLCCMLCSKRRQGRCALSVAVAG